MSWLKDRWQELAAQVNMNDGGATASTVRATRPPAPPAQTVSRPTPFAPQQTQSRQQPVQQRSLWSKAFDQVNTFDNNRTFKQATPTADRSGWQQAGVVAKNTVVDPIAVPAKNMTVNAVKLPTGYVQGAADAFGSKGQGSLLDRAASADAFSKARVRSLGASGDITRDLVAPGIDTGTNILSLGMAGFGAKQFGKQLGEEGLKVALKNQAGNVFGNTLLNAGQGANQTLYTDNPNLKSAATGAVVNAGVGTAGDLLMGGAGVGLGTLGTNAAKKAANTAANVPVTRLNQTGSVRLPFTAGEPNSRLLAVNNPDGARMGRLPVNNPDGARVRPLDINNPMGANTGRPLQVSNNTGAPLVGENISGAAQQSFMGKARSRLLQPLDEQGSVRNPLVRDPEAQIRANFDKLDRIGQAADRQAKNIDEARGIYREGNLPSSNEGSLLKAVDQRLEVPVPRKRLFAPLDEKGSVRNPLARGDDPISKGRQTIAEQYAETLKGIDDGARGGQLIPDGEGGMKRISEHSNVYSEFYANNKKKPGKQDWLEEARNQLESGKAPQEFQKAYNDLNDPEFQALLRSQERSTAPGTLGDSFEVPAPKQPTTKLVTKQVPQDTPPQLSQQVSRNTPGLQTNPSRQLDDLNVERGSSKQIPQRVNQKQPELSPNRPSELQRGFIKTVQEDPGTPQKVKDSVSSLYSVRNTKELQTKAANLVKDDPDTAMRIINSNEVNDQAVAVASEMMKKAQKAGNFEEAISIAENLAPKLTEAGRASQAASIYGKLTPSGVLRFTQKEINKFNKATGKNVKLDSVAAKKISDMSEKIQNMPDGYDKDVAIQTMVAEIQKTMPATLAEKVSTFQTMAQLLNPKTIIRNEVGNTAFLGLENISQTLATPVDALLGLFTKQRTTSLPSLKTQGKGLLEGRKKGVSESFKGINTGASTQYDLNSVPVFRSKVLGGLEKTMGAALRGGDRANYTAAFDDSLRGSMKLANVKTATPEMLEQAHHAGLYRTFQDTNVLSNFFTGMKKTLNHVGFGVDGKRFGLGDMILKYPKTPANLIARGIDYSPAGFAKTVFEMSKPLFGREFNQKAFVDSLSRATTGTGGLVGTGMILGSLGIITESPEKDKDLRELQKQSGQGGYQINVSALKRFVGSGLNKEAAKLREGDTLVSYDWAQPAAIPVSMGAAIGKGRGAAEGAGKSAGALAEGVTTITEQPMVRGLQQFFGSNKGAAGVVGDLAKDTPASFIPTFSNQVRQLTDNTTRNTYDPNVGKEMLNRVANKIPGVAGAVMPKYGTLGDVRENYQNGSNNPLNVFLNPAFVNKYQPKGSAKLPLDIASRSGETKQAPRAVATTQKVNGENVKITAKQNAELQQFVGDATKRTFDNLQNNPVFMSLSDEEKASQMSKLITDINKAGKIRILGDSSDGVSENVKKVVSMASLDYAEPKKKTAKEKTTKTATKSKKTSKAKGGSKKGGKKSAKAKKSKFDYTKSLANSASSVSSGSVTKSLRQILASATLKANRKK